MHKRLTDEEILAQIPAARARAKRESQSGIRALDASYDAERRLVVIHLKNGSFFGFPPDLAQGLRGASDEQLAEVEVTPSGDALHWETLDADFYVSALLTGVFGTKTWMRELGRAGGRVRSEAKSAAARRNGRKGGRPRS
jgi:hypothetical protein